MIGTFIKTYGPAHEILLLITQGSNQGSDEPALARIFAAYKHKMGHDARKPVFGGLRITKVQTSLPKVHLACHNIANGIKPGSDSKKTDKHDADCSKAVCWGVK